MKKSEDPLLFRVKVRAVVDWIDVGVEFEHTTNFWTVRGAAEEALGKKCWVEALDEAEGRAARSFRIRIQDPKNRFEIEAIVRTLSSKFGLAKPFNIPNIEISLDFSGKDLSPEDKRALVLRLKRSLYAEGRQRRQCAKSKHALSWLGWGDRLDSEKTLYVRSKNDPYYWRVYWKQRDRDIALEEGEQRARVEICVTNPVSSGYLIVCPTSGAFEFGPFKAAFRFRKPRDQDDPRYVEGSTDAALVHRIQIERRGVQAHRPSKKSRRIHSPHTVADRLMTAFVARSLRSLEKRFNAEKRQKCSEISPIARIPTEKPINSYQSPDICMNRSKPHGAPTTLITTKTTKYNPYIQLLSSSAHDRSPAGKDRPCQTDKKRTVIHIKRQSKKGEDKMRHHCRTSLGIPPATGRSNLSVNRTVKQFWKESDLHLCSIKRVVLEGIRVTQAHREKNISGPGISKLIGTGESKQSPIWKLSSQTNLVPAFRIGVVLKNWFEIPTRAYTRSPNTQLVASN